MIEKDCKKIVIIEKDGKKIVMIQKVVKDCDNQKDYDN